MRVLVLEDDDAVLFTLSEVLRNFDFQVTEAKTCEEASRILETQRFDLALLDYWLKGETCDAVAKQLRADGTPYVMMTAWNAAAELAQKIHADLWISKPFDIETLLVCMRSASKAPRSHLAPSPL